MVHFSGVKKWLWVAAVAALCGAQAASAGTLSATIDAEKSFLGDTDGAAVRVTLQNGAAQDLYLLH